MQHYYKLSTYIRKKYGQRVQKIPLDAGFSCPNRDGRLSWQGCVFCNPSGSGSGLGLKGYSLKQQWEFWQNKFKKRYKAELFWAYLQSFSNTYASLPALEYIFQEIKSFPQMTGICIGTRPDCLDSAKLELLASIPTKDTWLELGLQSSSDQTLKLINRGHDSSTFAKSVKLAHQKGLKTCAHIIIGLPGENAQHVFDTIEFINNLPVQGIKFHNLYICKKTTLASWWQKGLYLPMEKELFIHILTQSIARLRPDIIIQRLNGDPQPEELLSPGWAKEKISLLREINDYLKKNHIYQGQDYY